MSVQLQFPTYLFSPGTMTSRFISVTKLRFSIPLFVGALMMQPTASMAIPWLLDPGSGVQSTPLIPLKGGFTIDDEALPNPAVTASNVTVGSLLFTAADVVSATASNIDWIDIDNNYLSLVFSSALTPAGGSVSLDSSISQFTPFATGVPVSLTGSVTGSLPGPVTAVPAPPGFLGLGVFLAIRKAARRERRFSKLNQT
jgi:hypothetical protein